MTELKNKYVSLYDGKLQTYGGNQMLSSRKSVRRCGCGPVAAADAIIYLAGCESQCRNERVISLAGKQPSEKSEYFAFLDYLCRRFIPMIYPFGTNGFFLAAGINLFFLRNSMPFRAGWGCLFGNIRKRIDRMLEDDIPAILSIGPNFPFIFSGRHKLTLYKKRGDEFIQQTHVNAHYVAVTASDGKWLRISSWGKEYYINEDEYESYLKKHSCALFSNALYIRRKAGHKNENIG